MKKSNHLQFTIIYFQFIGDGFMMSTEYYQELQKFKGWAKLLEHLVNGRSALHWGIENKSLIISPKNKILLSLNLEVYMKIIFPHLLLHFYFSKITEKLLLNINLP